MAGAKKRGLGRGLDALLSSSSGAEESKSEAPLSDAALQELQIDRVEPGRFQPRKDIEPEALESLAQSIRQQGVLQPIVVRKLPEDDTRYEIIAGERRWRASQIAEKTTIPAVVREISDNIAMAAALVENIQREDLNAIEEAEALRRLIDECGLTHEACAEAVGRSRVAVSNMLRLLDLEMDVQQLVRNGKISMGHARALLAADPEDRVVIAGKIIAQELTVRQTEALVREFDAEPESEVKKPKPSAAFSGWAKSLTEQLGTQVNIKEAKGGKGQIVIRYESEDALKNIIGRIQ